MLTGANATSHFGADHCEQNLLNARKETKSL
jgi:hypothetical protein